MNFGFSVQQIRKILVSFGSYSKWGNTWIISEIIVVSRNLLDFTYRALKYIGPRAYI